MANVYKKLYQGQLGAVAATIYTVPASTSTIIKAWRAVNTSGTTVNFQLFQSGTANANAITPSLALNTGSFLTEDSTITMAAADTIAGVASSGSSITVTIYGLEIS